MHDRSERDFLIFRANRRSVATVELIRQLRSELEILELHPDSDKAVSCLLRAGELECALRDADSEFAGVGQSVTDWLARAAVGCDEGDDSAPGAAVVPACLALLTHIPDRGPLFVTTPEGFAYYGLHPLDYSDVAERIAARSSFAHVVGIRSIGTTLSAVVAAKLRAMGIAAERTTVRPKGHPYDRRCEFDAAQRGGIRSASGCGASFLVCDEGPGRSGSSFLSVAEALEREGVPAASIFLLCSYDPDLASLCANDAARRWRRYSTVASGMTRRLPSDAGLYVGGGEWRSRFVTPGEPWPAAWTQMERLKYLARDGRRIWKFEGHGHYGLEVSKRNRALAESGFGARYIGRQTGFGLHEMVEGRSAESSNAKPALLSQIAQYCAWRSGEFAVQDDGSAELAAMTRANLEAEFGRSPDVSLHVVRPTVCDGHMQSRKWLLTADGWVKLDVASHGDDHFFPGPCDIAWDLAGTIVEWNLDQSSREFLLREYQRNAGDDASGRLHGYELAYAAFRMGWCSMAAGPMRGTDDESRLLSDYRRYRDITERLLNRDMLASATAGRAASTSGSFTG